MWNVIFHTYNDQSYQYQVVDGHTADNIPNTNRTGFVFKGWTIRKEWNTNSEIKENSDLYAEYEIATFNISIDANGGSNSSNEIMEYGSALSQPETSRTGYNLNRWVYAADFENHKAGDQITFPVNITNNLSIRAEWTLIPYTISYVMNGATQPSYTTFNIETPTFTIPSVSKTNYRFDGWSGTGISGKVNTITISQGSTGNRTYTANFTAINYVISFTCDRYNITDTVTVTSGATSIPVAFKMYNRAPYEVKGNCTVKIGSNTLSYSDGYWRKTISVSAVKSDQTLTVSITSSYTVTTKSDFVSLLYNGTTSFSWREFTEEMRDFTLPSGITSLSFSNCLINNPCGWFIQKKTLTYINFSSCKIVSDNSYEMFAECSGLTTLGISGLDVSTVVDMQLMFSGLSFSSFSIPSSWSNARPYWINGMFSNCRYLKTIDILYLNTSLMTSFCALFRHCVSLTQLDLSNFCTSQCDIHAFYQFLDDTPKLALLILGDYCDGYENYPPTLAMRYKGGKAAVGKTFHSKNGSYYYLDTE